MDHRTKRNYLTEIQWMVSQVQTAVNEASTEDQPPFLALYTDLRKLWNDVEGGASSSFIKPNMTALKDRWQKLMTPEDPAEQGDVSLLLTPTVDSDALVKPVGQRLPGMVKKLGDAQTLILEVYGEALSVSPMAACIPAVNSLKEYASTMKGLMNELGKVPGL